MCKNLLAEFIERKFGYQRTDSGTGNQQKALNQFQFAVYYPTNWRLNYDRLLGNTPNVIRYGGLMPVSPYVGDVGYSGQLPMQQQPTIDLPMPYSYIQTV